MAVTGIGNAVVSTNAQQAVAQRGAAATLTWLHTLDPAAGERAGLRAAGVPEHTIWALYPTEFRAIVPALCAHLRERGARGLRHDQAGLDAQLVRLRQVRGALTPELELAHRAALAGQVGSVIERLAKDLRVQLRGAAIASDSATFTASALWYVWWLGHNRAALPQALQAAYDVAAHWFGVHLLQLPDLPPAPNR